MNTKLKTNEINLIKKYAKSFKPTYYIYLAPSI